MIMLDEVLKHDSLGNKTEIGFLLFHALSPGKTHAVSDVIRYCISSLFSIGLSIEGIIEILRFSSLVSVSGETISLNLKVFNPSNFKSETDYFNEEHFFNLLLRELDKFNGLKLLFNEDNLKFDYESNQYYVKPNLIKFRAFPLRNLLISLGFLIQNDCSSYITINTQFTSLFKSLVVEKLNEQTNKRKITLKQLKMNLERQEELGRESEQFVLNFEKNRLKMHPQLNKIEQISDNYVNAGYDILSFNDLDSVINDRFIEVKSYNNEISFHWSRNEIEAAKELGVKYYLYLVDRSMLDQKDYIPKIFENPYKKIFESDMWNKEAESWRFTLNDITQHGNF